MASSAKKCLYSFFFLILLSASQVKARESKFFSKVTHPNVPSPKYVVSSPSPSPAPAPAPEIEALVPSPAPSSGAEEWENGYGLYGREEGSNERFSPTKEIPTTAGVENELLSEEFAGEEGFETEFNENEAEPRRQSGDRVLDNGKYFSGPVTKNYYYGNNGYDQIKNSEQKGMSDTRFLENGRYFHDVKNENNYKYNYNNNNNNNNKYYNGYDQTAEKGSRYEFDSMEEYEKYQESRGYVP